MASQLPSSPMAIIERLEQLIATTRDTIQQAENVLNTGRAVLARERRRQRDLDRKLLTPTQAA